MLNWSILFLSALLSGSGVYTDDLETLIHGGRLYDKWWVDTKLTPPTERYPAYPAEGQAKDADTWRCKECHGWDYKGKDGAYRQGSHYTGVKGILAQSGAKPAEIFNILKDDQHGFDTVLSLNDLQALAFFVSNGLIDTDKYINRENKQAKGDQSKGQGFYEEHCRDCHGTRGRSLNLATKKGQKQYIGSIASSNPWEVLHKIRFGHPGAVMDTRQMHGMRGGMFEHHRAMERLWQAMPPMEGVLTLKEQIDLLSYLQTLPRK